jgi:hypothetical protein
MAHTHPANPQLGYPFEFHSDGHIHEVEQRSLDEIAACVEVILRYPIGHRETLPEFGIPELTFRESMEEVSTVLATHIARWEPDARIFIEARPDRWTQMVQEYIVRVEADIA